jgi:hypothetical protein
MFARLVRFSLGEDKSEVAKVLAADLKPRIAAMPGCQSVTIFGDTDGEFGVFVLWDSEANANSAAQVVRPLLDQHLAGHLKAPPDARLFQVIDS